MGIHTPWKLHIARVRYSGWKTQNIAVVAQQMGVFKHQQTEELLVVITAYPLKTDQRALRYPAKVIKRHHMVIKTVVEQG